MAIRASVRAHAALSFFVLAFVLSWYPWLLGMLGMPRANGINPLGVFAAALIVASIGEGRAGVRALLARVGRWRMGWRWLVAGLGVPVAILAAACALNLALGAAAPAPGQWAQWPEIVDRFVFVLLFVGLGEEPGWRGFALPALYRRRSPLAASLWLGVAWAAWHFPLMGSEFAWNVVPYFLVSVFAGSVVLAWLFNGSGESVPLCMLTHATVNAVGAGYAFRLFAGADLTRLWMLYAMLWVGAAALIAWRTGASLASSSGSAGIGNRPVAGSPA